MKGQVFETIGYFEEYYQNGKMIGTKKTKYDGIRKIGYYGRVNSVSKIDITLDNKKKIKKGIEFYTLIYPLCGKALK